MCVIYACYEKLPPIADLLLAEKINDDGGGMAWVDRKAKCVRWKKGLSAKEVVDNLEGKSLPLLIHFRIASEGGVSDELTHPFPCVPDAPTDLEGSAPGVLMHNGTWGTWKFDLKTAVERSGKKLPGGPWSDSRAMAWLVGNFGWGWLNFIESKQRIAQLTVEDSALMRMWHLDDWIAGDGFYQSSMVKGRVLRGESANFHQLHEVEGNTKLLSEGKGTLDQTKIQSLVDDFAVGNIRVVE